MKLRDIDKLGMAIVTFLVAVSLPTINSYKNRISAQTRKAVKNGREQCPIAINDPLDRLVIRGVYSCIEEP